MSRSSLYTQYSRNTLSTIGTLEPVQSKAVGALLIQSVHSIHLDMWRHFLRNVLLFSLTSQWEIQWSWKFWNGARQLASRRLMCSDKHLVKTGPTQNIFYYFQLSIPVKDTANPLSHHALASLNFFNWMQALAPVKAWSTDVTNKHEHTLATKYFYWAANEEK